MPDAAKIIYDFGPFRLDSGECILLRDGRHVPLMPKTFETLLALVERSGHLVRKEELMRKVWPDAFVEEVNLFKNISDLRKILGGDVAAQYIETIPKRGYRFIVQVRRSVEGTGSAERRSDPGANGVELKPMYGAALPGALVGREAKLEQLQRWLETAVRGWRNEDFLAVV